MPKRSLRKTQVGLYRLLVLGALVAALVYGSREDAESAWRPALVLGKAQEVMPEVASLGPFLDGSGGDASAGDASAELLDEGGALIGHATMTSPASDSAVGYAGATNVLVVFDAAWTVQGMRVLSSADTWSHLRKVELDSSFWEQWLGRSARFFSREDTGEDGRGFTVVSGATLTSEAIGHGLRARFSGEPAGGSYEVVPALTLVQEVFAEAQGLSPLPKREGVFRVLGEGDRVLGLLLRSSNQGGQPRGFNGASDVWVFLDATEETVVKVVLAGSRDNEPYLSDVREELKWADAFSGQRVSALLGAKPQSGPDLVVSGATVTSRAVGETVRGLLRSYREPMTEEPWWQGRDSVLVAWLLLAVAMAYSRWKGPKWRKWLRWASNITAILVGGVYLGVMLGMGSLVGWSRGALPWASFPGLVLLAAVALMVPVATGKNIYCAKLCAHGAAQGVLFGLTKWRWVPSARLHNGLKKVPVATLVLVLLLAAAGVRCDFSSFEPFDAWSVGVFAVVSFVIFVGGLMASLFIPKAYCKYGCPTGYLLDHLAASRSRLQRRDWLAGALAILSWVIVWVEGVVV